MKFLVTYSAFSILAAAMPAALPSEQALAAEPDKNAKSSSSSSSSSLLDRLSDRLSAAKAGDGDKKPSSSSSSSSSLSSAAASLLDKLSDRLAAAKNGDSAKGNDNKGNDNKGKEDRPKEDRPKEDKPKEKSQPKAKEEKKPEPTKSSGVKDLLDKLGAKASEAAKKPEPTKKPEAPKTPAPSVGSILGGGIKCGPVAVLFSRGTFEVGAQGLAVGSPFTTALQAVLPSGTVFWGNEYVNDVVGYLTGGSIQGSNQMKNKAQEYVDKCPGIKLVMGGYSQGAQVTHHALEAANAKTREAVKAVVLFGDPLSGRPIPGVSKDRVKTICGAGDTICWGLPVITLAHMTYGATDSMSAATWVKSKINS